MTKRRSCQRPLRHSSFGFRHSFSRTPPLLLHLPHHGFIRKAQAGSEEDRPVPQYRHPRPLQERGAVGRRQVRRRAVRKAHQDRHGGRGRAGDHRRDPHQFPRPRGEDGRDARTDQDQTQGDVGPARRSDPFCRQRPDGDHGGRRERGGQDDHDRQVRRHVAGRRPEGRARRRRHLSGRSRRATDDLGQTPGSGDRDRRLRQRSGQRGASRASPRPFRSAPTCALSTRPAGCKPSRA